MSDVLTVKGLAWVLLHGTPLTPAVWDGVVRTLRRHGDVICPDAAPTADAVHPQREVAMRILKDLYASERDAPGREHTGGWHVVGHSFGGQVAIELALAAPTLVRSLTLVCSRDTPFPSFAAAARARRERVPVDADTAVRRWFRPRDLEPGAALVDYARDCLQSADPDVWAAALDGIATYDRAADVAVLQMPVSLVATEYDQVSTPEAMLRMHEHLPGSSLFVQSDASHMTPFVDPAGLAHRILRASGARAG